MMEALTLAASLGSLIVVTLAAIGFGVRLGKIEQKLTGLDKLEERIDEEKDKRHELELKFAKKVAKAAG